MLKKLFVIFVILSFSFSVNAQNVEGVNARIDGMGGWGVPGDIGWTVDQPSKIFAYADHIQASGLIKEIEGMGTTYGEIVAIKSFLDNRFFIGLTFNDRRPMSGTFYKRAIEFGGFIENFGSAVLDKGVPRVPHLNFCIRPNDNLSIGFGSYFEASRYRATHKKELKYEFDVNDTTTIENKVKYDSTIVKKYFGIGFVVDAQIRMGPIKWQPYFKIFIPSLDGKVESKPYDNFNEKHAKKVTQNTSIIDLVDIANTTGIGNNLFLRIGSKLSSTIGETFWIAGLWYKTEQFQFERSITIDTTILANNTDPVTEKTEIEGKTCAFSKHCCDWWIGCEPEFFDNIIFGAGYSGGVHVYNKPPVKNETEDSTLIALKHKIRFGVEASVKGFWCFKEFLPRMGVTYFFGKDIWHYTGNMNPDSTVTDVDVNLPYNSNWDKDLMDAGKGTKLSAGFGLKGKRGTWDISLDVLEWKNGSIIGPKAAIVSFTFDFGRNEAKKEKVEKKEKESKEDIFDF